MFFAYSPYIVKLVLVQCVATLLLTVTCLEPLLHAVLSVQWVLVYTTDTS